MAEPMAQPFNPASPSARGPALAPQASYVLFIESLLILMLSILGTGGVIIGILHRKFDRKGRTQYAERRRRHMEIRRFLDVTVLILLGFEFVQSVNWLAGSIISEKLYGESAYARRTRQELSAREKKGLTQACQVIGGLTYGVDIFLYLWNACLAYSMYSWIVKKTLLRHLYERMKALAAVSCVVSVGASLVPLFKGSFGGRADVTCWLSTLDVRSVPVLLNKIIILPLCWISVGYLYAQTLSHIWRQRRIAPLITPVTKSYERLRRRLLLFALIFFFAWLLNSIWYFLLASNHASLLLGVIGKLYYAIGLLDALAYGYGASSMGGITLRLRFRYARLKQRLLLACRRCLGREGATPPSFATGTTPEEAREEGWSGLARAGGARLRRRPESEGGEGEGETGKGQYYRVRSSWFTFMPDHDVMGPFPEEPVELDVRDEKLALEREIAMEEGVVGRIGGAAVPPPAAALAPVLEFGERMQYVSARIFATSLNCGGVARLANLGCIEEWVPKDGYDLYVIALQECRLLGPLRRAIHYHLGGPRQFHLFEQELGDTLVSNGKIAILVFGRVADVQRGVLKLAETGRVASGIDLVFSRFHNKGVVGVALQYYGTAIAFLVAHYASDSGGRKRWERRDEDAWRTLHLLHLVGDVEDFDVHFQHHHVVLLGDLNYRCQGFVGEILGKIAAAAEVEKAQRGWAPYSGHAWRDDSYNRFFLPMLTRRSLVEAAEVQTRISTMRDPVMIAAQCAKQLRQQEQMKETKKDEEEGRRVRARGRVSSLSGSGWETAAEEEEGGGGRAARSFAMLEERESEWKEGSKGGSSTHCLADMLDRMRASKCPTTTQDCVESHDAAGAAHWAWSCEVDELSLSRKAGVALHGFQEAPLAFPPTFKFFPGRSVEDYADVVDLQYGYQVSKGKASGAGSPKESRPPSWTDRILFHSLPGLESRLYLEAYDACDAITGSDHRHVVASFQLLLDKPASPAASGEPILPPPPRPPPSLFQPGALPRLPPRPLARSLPPRQPPLPQIKRLGPTAAEEAVPRSMALTVSRASSAASGVFPTRRPTPAVSSSSAGALPPPLPLSRMTTAASSAAAFQPLVPPAMLVTAAKKSVLLSVRLSNFAFRFRLPHKPALQIAQQKGHKTATTRQQSSNEASASVAVVAVADEGGGSAVRRSTAATTEPAKSAEDEEADTEIGEAWQDSCRGEGGAVTAQLGEHPPPYTRKRSMPFSSRSLRGFRGAGGGAATAAARQQRAREREEEAVRPPTEEDIGWAVIMMPIPCEDPLTSHRRVVMMLDDPGEGAPSPPPPPPLNTATTSTAAAGNGSNATTGMSIGARLHSRLWPKRLSPASSGEEGGVELPAGSFPEVGGTDSQLRRATAAAAAEAEAHSRQHIHRFTWADVRAKAAQAGSGAGGGYLRFQALVAPVSGMHAAVKFLHKKGHDLGQGVMCMKELVMRGQAGPQRMTMQLSVGGVHFGEVDMDVVIKSRAAPNASNGTAAQASMSRVPSLNTLVGAAAGGGGPGLPLVHREEKETG